MNKVSEFQTINGLMPDGVLGKKTFDKMKSVWGIKTDKQLANFLGQISHESGEFKLDKENLNYSPRVLASIFKKYFKTIEIINQYANKPEKIANKVYADRMGNGNEVSGDGWRYRGAGGLQITGAINYKDFSKWIGASRELTTNEIANKYFWETGLYYFEKNKLWDIALEFDDKTKIMGRGFENGNIIRLTNRINGGQNGIEDRIEKTHKFYKQITA